MGKWLNRVMQVHEARASDLNRKLIGTFRSEDGDDYEYEFSVLSTRTSKNVGLQT